jgi:hypothetical protein
MTAWFGKRGDLDDEFEEPPDSQSMAADMARRRRMAGTVAVSVSAIAHVLLFLNLPGFGLFETVRPAKERPYAKLRLAEVRTETVRRQPVTVPDRGATGAADRRAAPARDVLSFKQPVDESLLQPKPVPQAAVVGETRGVARPEPKPTAKAWDPRPEIVEIQKTVLADPVGATPRRLQPLVERTARMTADIIPPADSVLPAGPPSPRVPGLFDNLFGEIGPIGDPMAGGIPIVATAPVTVPRDPLATVPPPTQAIAAVVAPPEPTIRTRHIENMLKVKLTTGENPADPDYLYCKVSIERAGDDVLPVLPKDLMFVQDCSASISEQKLYFCREGLVKALALVGPADRFNILGFRDSPQLAFTTWAKRSAETLKHGEDFIRAMRSAGDTDLFGSLQRLLRMPREPDRPVIVILISDGAPTRGLTDSTTIIEEFSQANAGTLSVFTLGTYAGANAYLLDLISYRNRGDTRVVTSGRWDIPGVVEGRVREVGRPVLTGLHFIFAASSGSQAYPLLTSNLYLDRPLVVLARVPKTEKNLLFQAVGRAGDADCDMIFNLSLTEGADKDPSIPTSWAWQRIYHLIGVYTRTRNPAVLEDIRSTAKQYRLKVPYEDWLRL